VTDDQLLNWFPYGFPFLFVGMWLAITTMLGFTSGWFNLQQWYPDDGGEEPLLKLRGQSGSMGTGMGVALNGCLKLRAYRSGLGIGIWRVFGVFQKPLKIPWSEIEAEPTRGFFLPMVKLQLGKPSNGTLKISADSWSRLVAAAKPVALGPLPYAAPVNRPSTARRMLLQWIAITVLGGTLFCVVSWSWPDRPPPLILFALPVVFFIPLLIRFARLG